eukprot:7647-Ditylum_brightwellii.AAC.1
MRYGLIPWRMRKNLKTMSFWTPEMHALNCAKLCVNGLSYEKKPWDYDALRPSFGWKPIELAHEKLGWLTPEETGCPRKT